MDAQAENGLPNLPCMPYDSTIRAWKAIEQSLKHDKGIMLEIFNEPCRADSPDGRKTWSQGMQSLIDSLRSDGAENILLLDGLGFAQHTDGLFPLVHDRLPNRLAMVVHPYGEFAGACRSQPCGRLSRTPVRRARRPNIPLLPRSGMRRKPTHASGMRLRRLRRPSCDICRRNILG